MYETIYLLTNPLMPNIVKIGRTRNLERRVRDLSAQTGIPVPFEVYYACKVKDAKRVEKRIHDAFQDNRVNPKREFFEINPERIISILDLFEVNDVTPDEDIVVDNEEQETLNRARNRSQYFSLVSAGISVGATLTFVKNDKYKATVVKNNRIEFEREITSLTGAAMKILKRENGKDLKAVRGPNYWKYKDETLTDRKIRLEILESTTDQNEDVEVHKVSENTQPRKRFTFESADVPIGSVITFTKDDKFKATVVDSTKIKFEDEITSLSRAAMKIFKREYGNDLKAARGPDYWRFNDERLTDRISRLENIDTSNNSKKRKINQKPNIDTQNQSQGYFVQLNIPEGSILTFKLDENINATVVNGKKIKFEGKITSLSKAAKKILKRDFGKDWKTVRGTIFWTYKGETLADRKERLESE